MNEIKYGYLEKQVSDIAKEFGCKEIEVVRVASGGIMIVKQEKTIDKIKAILENHNAEKIQGAMIDVQSANLIMTFHNAYSEKCKAQIEKALDENVAVVVQNLWARYQAIQIEKGNNPF